MARERRVWYPGATYHITSRGNRRYIIFVDDWDRRQYLSLIMQIRKQHPFILHSYCLMTNHIHLLLETIDTPLNKIMKLLNQRYAAYFNKRHDFDGHVFQGRYGAELIDSIGYFLYASKYIHLNPVDAKIVSHPLHYRWSSYRLFLQGKQSPLVHTEKILSYFPDPNRSYQNFVEEGVRPNSK
jgi:putative transposase